MEKENAKNSKLQANKLRSDSLESVAGGNDPFKDQTNGFASCLKKSLGAGFKKGWMSQAEWTEDLNQALIATFGEEAYKDIRRLYKNPSILFGVATIDKNGFKFNKPSDLI